MCFFAMSCLLLPSKTLCRLRFRFPWSLSAETPQSVGTAGEFHLVTPALPCVVKYSHSRSVSAPSGHAAIYLASYAADHPGWVTCIIQRIVGLLPSTVLVATFRPPNSEWGCGEETADRITIRRRAGSPKPAGRLRVNKLLSRRFCGHRFNCIRIIEVLFGYRLQSSSKSD